jgi:primosomal protein N' (replication factor Y) (superfamily II helicase)
MSEQVNPLRLKRERTTPRLSPAEKLPFAQVVVDTGIPHLQEPFDYVIPSHLDELIFPGSVVVVPFRNRSVKGMVVARHDEPSVSGNIRAISKVLSKIPPFDPQYRDFLHQVAERYATTFWDVARFALESDIPIAGGEISPERDRRGSAAPSKRRPVAYDLDSAPNWPTQICALVDSAREHHQILVVLPDARDVAFFENVRRNYEWTRSDTPQLIVGNRSSIFSRLQSGAMILIFNDGDESSYERRSPYWNVRDLALLRAREFQVIFVSFSQSLEITRLVENGYIKHRRSRSGVQASFAVPPKGSEFDVIRSGLKRGPVLISTVKKGYLLSFSCSSCRNIALCECGGRFYVAKKGRREIIRCSICSQEQAQWRCAYCGKGERRTVQKGHERLAEEYGRAFPGIPILLASAEGDPDVPPEVPALVISTLGTEPPVTYSAIVLRDSNLLLSRVGLRTGDFIRRTWFSTLALLESGGKVYLDCDPLEPIASALITWNSYKATLTEMKELQELPLPPFYRLILIKVIKGSKGDLLRVREHLEESKLFTAIDITSLGYLIARSPIEKSREVSLFFGQYRRLRSLKKLANVEIRMDPYELEM